MKLLAERPDFLDKPFVPELYDYWDDEILADPNEGARSKTMLEYLAEQLDEGKIRIPWPRSWDDTGHAENAIKFLEQRAKDANGPLKLRLDRIVSLYAQKRARYEKSKSGY